MKELKCVNCNKAPSEIHEYIEAAAEEGITPEDYVRSQEGTYNYQNEHFYCTLCYSVIGMPLGVVP